jgi:hypothetical protein
MGTKYEVDIAIIERLLKWRHDENPIMQVFDMCP